MARDRRARAGRTETHPPPAPAEERTEPADSPVPGTSAAPSAGTEEPARTPTDLSKGSWWGAIKRTAKEFQRDNLTDWAAALTYYGILSIFPAILVLVSLVGLAGEDRTQEIIANVEEVVPDELGQVLTNAIENLPRAGSGAIAIIGLLAAVWSASGYIGAFIRASNVIYDVPEGRPIWKKLPIRVGITVLMMVLLAAVAIGIVLTGDVAREVGDIVGIGDTAVQVWDIAKWPVLLLIVSFMFALLYWASPNARQRFRWVSPGGLLAVVLWVVASVAFAIYVANFGSYNATYGSLAGVIIFLIWLWISNIAILLGAEFNAELERSRAIEDGHVPGREPYVELRDTTKIQD